MKGKLSFGTRKENFSGKGTFVSMNITRKGEGEGAGGDLALGSPTWTGRFLILDGLLGSGLVRSVSVATCSLQGAQEDYTDRDYGQLPSSASRTHGL